MTNLDNLNSFRKTRPTPVTCGLSDVVVSEFLEDDKSLQYILSNFQKAFDKFAASSPELVSLNEEELMKKVQEKILNFYPEENKSPYVPLIAKGPWVLTLFGSILYDIGGYGMLGFGHNPDSVMEALREDQCMANVMTPHALSLIHI